MSTPNNDQNYPVVQGYTLTPEFLAQTELFFGVRYFRHPNGGGYIAASSFADPNAFVPPSVRIGPDTFLLDDRNLAGRTFLQGDVFVDSRNPETAICRKTSHREGVLWNRSSGHDGLSSYSHVSL